MAASKRAMSATNFTAASGLGISYKKVVPLGVNSCWECRLFCANVVGQFRGLGESPFPNSPSMPKCAKLAASGVLRTEAQENALLAFIEQVEWSYRFLKSLAGFNNER